MLPRKNRISRKEFGNIIISKLGFNTDHFSLRVLSGASGPRLAVSVSKKVSKKAVVRNRVRRRVYAVVSGFVDQLKDNFYLIVAKPKAESLMGEPLTKELNLLLKSFKRS